MPSMPRYMVLSLVLHVLLVLLLGDTQREGEGERSGGYLRGEFRATLMPRAQSDAASGGTSLKMDRSLSVPNFPQRTPIATSGQSTVETPAAAAMPLSAAGSTIAPREGAAPAPLVPGTSPSEEVLSYVAKEVATPTSNFVVSPPTSMPETAAPAGELRQPVLIPEPMLTKPAPLAATAPQRALLPAQLPRVAPVLPPPAELPLSGAKIDRQYAPVAEPLPILVPIPPTAIPVQPTLVPATVTRDYAPVAEPLPLVLPIKPAPETAPLPLAPARIEREYLPVAEPLPTIAPTAPAIPVGRDLPAYVAPNEVAPNNVAPKIEPRDSPVTRNETVVAPGAAATTSTATTSPSTSSIAAPRAVPKLDLDAIRQRARGMPSDGAQPGSGPRTVFQFPTPPPEAIKSKDAKIFDKALKRPDCRDAYAQMDLAAVVPLVADALTNKGCKW